MAGRIREDDIAQLRERVDVAAVIGEHVTLRNAGGGSLKGLCPFHDEKTPSFHVTPARGLWHCFGCAEGGDAIAFLMKIDHLSFAEAVERLATHAGLELHYEQGGAAPRQQQGERTRLLAAHRAAAEFFAERLGSPEAAAGREFLERRGFDRQAAEQFGVGFAPRAWDVLTRHLLGQGYGLDDLVKGGLARQGQRGPIDRFRGRLIWPIRDLTGDVVGFGARRLFDDDQGPKYLNTPETPIFHKSQVLYGADLAKREIARRSQAVVVEGYTDVMACHLAGVPTAVATSGTAFGSDHIKILRRLLMDQDEFRGEVVFSFDGDSAGQKAAVRAFADDQRFVTQTFVAVSPDGLDPCDLRVAKGDVAIRDLIARRVPLFEFVIRGAVARFDLDTPEGRVGALAAAAPVVAGIRDHSLRPEYARTLAGWLGMDVDPVREAVARAARGRRDGAPPAPSAPSGVAGAARPDPDDPALAVERETLKLALQHPALAGASFDAVGPGTFTDPAYAAVRDAVAAAGGAVAAATGGRWPGEVLDRAPDDAVRSLVTELAVEPLRAVSEPDERYARSLLARLEELEVTRRVAQVKSRLQRINPLTAADDYNRLFGELVALEQQRRSLRESGFGAV